MRPVVYSLLQLHRLAVPQCSMGIYQTDNSEYSTERIIF
jgi:hypothetical protein